MDFRHTALANDRFEVTHAEAASGHDGDSPASMIDECCKILDSLLGSGPTAGRQHAFNAQVNQAVERLERVRYLVERLVERHSHRSG